MRSIRVAILVFIAAGFCAAQQWEVGAGAGAGFVPGVSVTSPSGSATAGFESGAAFGVFLGQNLYRHLGGEVHYAFMQSNLRLQSGGNTATFSGQSHVVYYDLILHTRRSESRTQVYAAVGGGMKIFRGTGKEVAYQPLSQFGYFTKTHTLKPMVDFGGGVKFQLSPRVYLRTEVRDYLTVFPEDIIAPAPGAKFGKMLHDIVPMVSLSYVY